MISHDSCYIFLFPIFTAWLLNAWNPQELATATAGGVQLPFFPQCYPHTQPRLVQVQQPQESRDARQARLAKLQSVKDAMQHSWTNYKKFAWGRAELAPLSGQGKDRWGSWPATAIDSLDTLWIMGMKEEFEDALDIVRKMDWTTYKDPEIPLFETTIRFLGGLLGAYDISGHRYPVLLEKATQLADVLIGAFNTPNGIPVLYYKHKGGGVKGQRASESAGLAEMGTLSMEFTRLAQLTSNRRYFDVVQHVTDSLEAIQFETKLPGMWPTILNASINCDSPSSRSGTSGSKQKSQHPLGNDNECNPIRPIIGDYEETYTFGAASDSWYEYLLKMHMLLSNGEEQYKDMYTSSMNVAKRLLFRPDMPGNPDILLPGNIQMSNKGEEFIRMAEHLSCFAGGMFALGSKVLDIRDDFTLGRKITSGCITMYNTTALGIMPEILDVKDCTSSKETDCTTIVARDTRYLLRPEAIESVFILHRLTGERHWQDSAWDMWQSIIRAAKTPHGFAEVADVTKPVSKENLNDNMESFWPAETLKYFYLIFDEFSNVNLNEYVFTTEAHPFLLRDNCR